MAQNKNTDGRREESKPGHEAQEGGRGRQHDDQAGGISNRDLEEELNRQDRLPDRGTSREDE